MLRYKQFTIRKRGRYKFRPGRKIARTFLAGLYELLAETEASVGRVPQPLGLFSPMGRLVAYGSWGEGVPVRHPLRPMRILPPIPVRSEQFAFHRR
jgi:hypothetical protein